MNFIKKTREANTSGAKHSNNLLTPGEVAEMLGVSPGTLAVWRTSKRYPLPYVKSGRLVRYRFEAVQAFIDGRTVEV